MNGRRARRAASCTSSGPREAWRLAAEATGDEAIGIHVAEARTPAAVDVLEYAFRASPSLRDALGQVVRHGRVTSAFHRWFKRRTGRTPLEFRRKAAQRGAAVDQ
jgi:methylphosphotriester-DNA--protein-cysteine methyltransferase